MLKWIVLATILTWAGVSSEVRAETALVPIYQDVLRNCKGASESTRRTIIQTALTSGGRRPLHVSSVVIQELSDRSPDPYPAYVGSSVELCGVNVSVPSTVASLSEKFSLKIVPWGQDAMAAADTLRLVASKRYENFDVRYIVIIPTRAQFDTFRKGERISFTAQTVGVRQRPDALEVTAVLESLEPAPAPHPAEDVLVSRYEDVMKNCEGAPQQARTMIVASALRRAAQNSLAGLEIGVSSAIVMGVFQPNDERYPALAASSAGLCEVAVSDKDLASSLASKHKFKTKREGGVAIIQNVLRVVASKRYADFEVTYTLVVPTGSSLAIPAVGQRISFSTLFLGASDRGTIGLTGVLTKLEPN